MRKLLCFIIVLALILCLVPAYATGAAEAPELIDLINATDGPDEDVDGVDAVEAERAAYSQGSLSLSAQAQLETEQLRAAAGTMSLFALEKAYSGVGSAATPFRIGTAEVLAELSELVVDNATFGDGLKFADAHYLLTADIDLGGAAWRPIGTASKPFLGHFDGDSHLISGLNVDYNDYGADYLGLFGYAGSGAVIEKLGVSGAIRNLPGSSAGGGVAGMLEGGQVSNCYTICTLSNNDAQSNIGGVVGTLSAGEVSNCVALGRSLSNNGGEARRIVGFTGGSSPLSDNYAWAGMEVNDSLVVGGAANDRNGADLAWDVAAQKLKAADGFVWDGPVPDWISAEQPFIIATAEDLAALASRVNAGLEAAGRYYLLTADIDLTGKDHSGMHGGNWTPIGLSEAKSFKGHFDGGGHLVSGLNVSITGGSAGLFGQVEGGSVRNLGVSGTVTSHAGGHAGGVAARLSGKGTVSNCYSLVRASAGSTSMCGGVVGYILNGSVDNCVALGESVSAGSTSDSGRVVGSGYGITNCYAWAGMTVNGAPVNTGAANGKNGADLSWDETTKTLKTADGKFTWEDSIPDWILGSDGSAENPYLIESAAQLTDLSNLVNGGSSRYGYTHDEGVHYRLTSNIDLTGFDSDTNPNNGNWSPIGKYLSDSFRGSFDGGGHVISGLNVSGNLDYAGLFGYADSGSKISNLGVSGAVASSAGSESYAGILAGRTKGEIRDCYTTGTVSVDGTDCWAGGVVGGVEKGAARAKVSNCYSTATVSGTKSYCGGVAGRIDMSSISNCLALGSGVTSRTGSAGRVVADVVTDCVLTNNYAWTGMKVNGATLSSNDATSKNGADVGYNTGKGLTLNGAAFDWASNGFLDGADGVWNLPAQKEQLPKLQNQSSYLQIPLNAVRLYGPVTLVFEPTHFSAAPTLDSHSSQYEAGTAISVNPGTVVAGRRQPEVKVYMTEEPHTLITMTGNSFTMPTYAVTVSITTAEKKTLSINETQQTAVYDGSAKPFAVVSTQPGISGFSVEYKPAGAEASVYTADVPTAAGLYDVRVSRPEDDNYQAFSSEIAQGLSINVPEPEPTPTGGNSRPRPSAADIQPEQHLSNPFSDVRESDWFYDDVLSAYAGGLVNGRTADTYAPYGSITIAEAVKLAACMRQLNEAGSVTLLNGAPVWYSTYMDYALVQGIISVGQFEDYTAIATRAEVAAIFAHTLPVAALPQINQVKDGDIPDVKFSDSYGSEVYQLYQAGILRGNDTNLTFAPGSDIKRSEVAAIVTRMMHSEKRVEL